MRACGACELLIVRREDEWSLRCATTRNGSGEMNRVKCANGSWQWLRSNREDVFVETVQLEPREQCDEYRALLGEVGFIELITMPELVERTEGFDTQQHARKSKLQFVPLG